MGISVKVAKFRYSGARYGSITDRVIWEWRGLFWVLWCEWSDYFNKGLFLFMKMRGRMVCVCVIITLARAEEGDCLVQGTLFFWRVIHFMVGLVCRPQVQKALLFLSQPTLLGQIGTWERYTSEGDHNFNGGRGLLLSLWVGPYQTTFLHLTSCGCGALIFLLHTLGLDWGLALSIMYIVHITPFWGHIWTGIWWIVKKILALIWWVLVISWFIQWCEVYYLFIILDEMPLE